MNDPQSLRYVTSLLGPDPYYEEVQQLLADRGWPTVSVHPLIGRLLTLLVQISGARRVLEIGALAGYSGICLTRGLPPDGELTSLELKEEFAAVAEAQVRKAGFQGRLRYLVGPARERLQQLKAAGERFDFFFLDADKSNYEDYVELAISMANPHALIVADNVLWRGRVWNAADHTPNATALRQLNQKMSADPRLECVILPIVDGLAVARVRAHH